jgi:hypothetical protein
MMPRFRKFACIDWSGAIGPRQKGIAVAMCEAGRRAPVLIEPPDRYWSRNAMLDWLMQQAHTGDDMVIGLDLSFALPFADANGYFPGWIDSPGNARQLWEQVDCLCSGDEHFSVSSFVAHPEIARHFRQQRACGDLFGMGRGRLRVCEADGQALIEGINPYSCFNLVGAAQVGKSSLTGMRVLHRLASAIPIWPFDLLPASGPVIVEIYTSIAARASAMLPKGKSKIMDGATLDRALAQFNSDPHQTLSNGYTDHATDAMLTAAWLRQAANTQANWQPTKLTPHIAQTEGWTFGVV